MKTGDCKVVDDFVNNVWPQDAKEAVRKHIPDWKHIVKFRTAEHPSVCNSLDSSFQLIINYNPYTKCFIVWNAAIQKEIHQGKRISLSLGKDGEEKLHENIDSNSIIPVFRNIGRGNTGQVELAFIVGANAIGEFCKTYKERMKPDCKCIPEGKRCLYAASGEEITYISSEKEDESKCPNL